MYNGGMLACVLDYAQRGFRILPVASDGDKSVPKIEDWPNLATADPAQLTEWFTRWPDANIGVLTGAASGLVAIDVDVKHDDKGLSGYLTMMDFEESCPEVDWAGGVRARTASGGMHIYFTRHDPLTSHINWLPDVDLLADEHFVVVPPSSKIIDGYERQYKFLGPGFDALREMPDAILAARRSLPRVVNGQGRARGSGGDGSGGPVSDLDLSRLLKEGFRNGQRDDGFYRLACSQTRLYPDDPELVEDNLRQVWEMTDQGHDPFPWSMVRKKLNDARAFIKKSDAEEREDLLRSIRALLGVRQ